ncbi:MAG TPA: flavin reductase family protein, partial [Blastocatellia bacterium]|nr:flavin reductase family protein [Blastocatellia bacterium]
MRHGAVRRARGVTESSKGQQTLLRHGGLAPATLRQVMAQFPTGVTVVTTCFGKVMHGVTANAFTSVSLEPPLVLVCVSKGGRFATLVENAGTFCINILADYACDLSDRFARKRDAGEVMFADCTSGQTPAGAPILTDAVAYLDCEIAATYPGGDHIIFLGLVRHAVRGETELRKPLLFYQGRYHAIGRTLNSPA